MSEDMPIGHAVYGQEESTDTPIPDAWIAYCAAFHELFPRSGNVELSAAAIQQLACNLKADGERENASLREELAETRRETGLAKLVIQQKQDQIASAEAALEQAEARALEYKTEHAALLGTSQWQEVEIADLRDDVKRLMQTVSECEERALAAEKDKS